MSEIALDLTIRATPEDVFHAIAEQDGITRWWANRVRAEPRVGAITEIRFDNGEVMEMEVTACAVGQTVQWRVRVAPHDWEGSTITWDLTATSNGTKLRFGQHDLVVGTTGYRIEQTRAGWEYFLGSLKSYLETGRGTPYLSDDRS